MHSRTIVRLLLTVGMVGAIAYGVYHSGVLSHFDVAELRMYITDAGALAPLLYVGTYVVATVLFVPGTAITLLGGALFGPWWGTLYTVVGATIGASLAFFIARFLGRGLLRSALKTERFAHLQHFDEGLKERGFVTTLILRIVPLFPFNALNYGLGFTAVSPRAYILATLLGIIPGTFAYTYFGDSLAMLNIMSIAIAVALILSVAIIGRYLSKQYGYSAGK